MTQKAGKSHLNEFANWYKSIDLEADSTRCQLRLKGVQQIIDSIDRQDIEALLKSVYRNAGVVQPNNLPKLKAIFKKLDENFDEIENVREMEVLSGAVLGIACHADDKAAIEVALSVCTSNFKGARAYDLPNELLRMATEAVQRIAEAKRLRPSSKKLLNSQVDFTTAKEKITTAVDPSTITSAFDDVAKILSKINEALINQLQAAMRSSQDFSEMQDEELQMLWWIFGEQLCNGKSFKDVPADKRPLEITKELAEITVIVPGRPLTIRSLLAKAGISNSSKLSIPTAVNACELSWLEKLTCPSGFPMSSPIHFAVQKRLETGDEKNWIAGWSSITGISKDFKVSHLDLAESFYNERQLILNMED